MKRVRVDPFHIVEVQRVWTSRARPAVIHQVGKAWALLRLVDDLRFDGWEWVRVSDMTTARATPHTRFADRVLEPGLVREPSCALDSTAALLSSLSRRRLVAVECEADDDFLLGRIISVDQTTAVVHAIDARGRWARHATRLELDDVTRVQRCHYERCFERHGDPWPGRPGDVRRRSTQA